MVGGGGSSTPPSRRHGWQTRKPLTRSGTWGAIERSVFADSRRGTGKRGGLRVIHASALFATCLRTNPRSLENWEQGRAKPNAQAALLIGLVRKYPDMVARLAEV